MTSTEKLIPQSTSQTGQAMQPQKDQASLSSTGSQTTDQQNLLLTFQLFKRSDKGKKLASWVKKNYQRCKSDRLRIERQWDINLEMYGGRQWLEVVGTGPEARLMTPPAPRHRVRATVNLIRPLIRTEIARQSSQQPTAFVIPSSSNETAISAANGGEAVWRSICERKDFQQRIMGDAAFWNSITGNAFIKEVWNATMTDPGNLEQDPTDPQGPGKPAVGDVDLGVVRPYNLFIPDLLAKDIEDQPYTFEAYTKPVEWVKRFFKGMLENDVVPDSSARSEIFQSRYFGSGLDSDAMPDSVLILECYIKPGGCEYFPDGGMVTLVGDELVQVAQTFPFSHGEYPYAHIRHIPTGKFYGDSVLIDVNPLQREYNGTRSHIIESKRLMAKPQLLVPKGSMQSRKYTSEPGALVEYNPGMGKPEPLQLQSLPNYVLEELNVLKADMDDISGQHAPSRGMAPGQGVTAATAIAFLQEKDDNIMTPTYDSIESAVQKTARHTLIDVQERWDTARIVRVTGMDGAFNALELKGVEISTDIKVESGSSLPQSRPARQAFLMELFQSQAITAPMLLDMLDMGGIQKLTEQIRVDRDQAVRENLKMKRLTGDDINMYNQQKVMEKQTGQTEQGPDGAPIYTQPDPATFPPMVDVHDYDNHEVHIKTHDNYRKTAEFEALDPAIQAEFNRHIRLHHAYVDSQAQAQMQAAMMGSPPSSESTGGNPGAAMQPGGAPPPEPSAPEDQSALPGQGGG